MNDLPKKNVITLRILRKANPGLPGGRGLIPMTTVLRRVRQGQERRRQCDDRGRDWGDEVINEGMPAATGRWRHRTSRKRKVRLALFFQFLVSRAVRE